MRITLLFAALLLSRVAVAQSVVILILSQSSNQDALAGHIAYAIEGQLPKQYEVTHYREIVGTQAPSVRAEGKLQHETRQALELAQASAPDAGHIAGDLGLERDMRLAAPTAFVGEEVGAAVALGAIAWRHGDIPLSEQWLANAFSMEPGARLPSLVDQGFAEHGQRVRFEVGDRAKGALALETEPSGARVVIDGTARGTTPLTVSGLNQGMHLVQVDRFGNELRGELVELGPRTVEKRFRLADDATLGASDVLQAVQAVFASNPDAVADFARGWEASLAVVGLIVHRGDKDTLQLAVVDADDVRVIGAGKVKVEGDDTGTRASAMAAALIQGKRGPGKPVDQSKAKPRDPLDNVSGTEDW